ncbi:uncharacterized protein EV154DRAFT_485622 [Mucor mucedo]|uniref:uncharacterized protein n=1 Tax=Mucor mucedo TaxID=29922 RepID=UPI00221FA74B|nr:uncharacterized protein EV154DRAFT_485622 [Mucor mucedo]KAI7882294.1 hypothetical protein EV154DRAFT_485622 [Mucor mucedo]
MTTLHPRTADAAVNCIIYCLATTNLPNAISSHWKWYLKEGESVKFQKLLVDDYAIGTADEIEELPEEFHNSFHDHNFQHEENERGKSNDGVKLASFPELPSKIFSTLREIDDFSKSVVAEQFNVEVLHNLTEVKEKLLGSKFDLAAILPPLTNMKVKGTRRLEIAVEKMQKQVRGPRRGDINNMVLEVSLSSNFNLDDITAVYSPVGDGQCGFRCLAMPLYGYQSQWMEHLSDVQTYFVRRKSKQRTFEEILTSKDSPCAPHFYFNAADYPQFAADAFGRAIAVYTVSSKALVRPGLLLWCNPSSLKGIHILPRAGHFYLINPKKRECGRAVSCILPDDNPYHKAVMKKCSNLCENDFTILF